MVATDGAIDTEVPTSFIKSKFMLFSPIFGNLCISFFSFLVKSSGEGRGCVDLIFDSSSIVSEDLIDFLSIENLFPWLSWSFLGKVLG
jgi:hypothetical protein